MCDPTGPLHLKKKILHAVFQIFVDAKNEL